MLKVAHEAILPNKGARTFEFDVVFDRDGDQAIYDAGVGLEKERLENGSFAEQVFDQLLPTNLSSTDDSEHQE